MRFFRTAGEVACAVGALAMAAGQAVGQVYEPFDYPGVASLIGGHGGTGWSGPWQTAGYGDLGVGDKSSPYIIKHARIPDAGGRAEGVEGGVQRSLASSFGTPGTTMWGRCSMQQTGGTAANSWLGVKLQCSGPGSDPFLWIGKPFNRTNIGVEKGTSASVHETSSASLNFTKIAWKVNFRAGPDDVYVWIDAPVDAEPDESTADLVLPAYGNFEGMGKVLLEMGSTGSDAHGWIDELRLGSSFAEVTPLAPEMYSDGRAKRALPGGTLEALPSSDGGPDIRVHNNNPGTALPFGVELPMETTGGGVHFGPGDLAASGGEIKIKHKGWDGLIYGNHRSRPAPGGGFEQELEFPGAAAIRHRVFDGNGNPIQDDVTPGDFRIVNTGVISGPCPGGGFPQWWFTTIFYNPPKYVNGQYIELEHTWVFGCNQNVPHLRTISTPLYDAPPVTPTGLGSLAVEAFRPAFFDVFYEIGIAPLDEGNKAGMTIAGLGEGLIGDEQCDDGSDSCLDWSGRRLPVRNLGSSGEDGVEIKWPRAGTVESGGAGVWSPPGEPTLVELELKSLELHNSFGGMRVSHMGDGPGQVPIELVALELQGLGHGEGVSARPDFSGMGSSGYVIEVYQGGVLVGQSVRDNGDDIVFKQLCPPPLVPIWGWVGNG